MKESGNTPKNTPSSPPPEKSTDSNIHTWTPERIKYELEIRGHTLASISRSAGFHESAARTALRRPWPKIERIIADCLGIHSPSEIFPERYDDDGLPIKYTRMNGNQNAKRGKNSE